MAVSGNGVRSRRALHSPRVRSTNGLAPASPMIVTPASSQPLLLRRGAPLRPGDCHMLWCCLPSARWGLVAQFAAPLKTLTLREGGTHQGRGELRAQSRRTERCEPTASGNHLCTPRRGKGERSPQEAKGRGRRTPGPRVGG
ncbi:hypothetical protein SBRY_10269 [Actinacidiphila bryophytorum]|uniref:Uncharacterized protein n=1 Tax=Actinacidiphila bryophytorum TaxID=1436133 RepID=A0A9W4E5Z9_9ACTN|nr:hypothetical protein SBRY_10269 [Actinacidiphila bryophytorum]